MQSLEMLNCRERHMVISVSAGKDLTTLLPILASKANSLVATRADRRRSLEPAVIADWAGRHLARLPLRVIEDPRQAVL